MWYTINKQTNKNINVKCYEENKQSTVAEKYMVKFTLWDRWLYFHLSDKETQSWKD